ncbi:MAG: hypothetical protein ABIA04_04910 [Pseudomonadota bacterium]
MKIRTILIIFFIFNLLVSFSVIAEEDEEFFENIPKKNFSNIRIDKMQKDEISDINYPSVDKIPITPGQEKIYYGSVDPSYLEDSVANNSDFVYHNESDMISSNEPPVIYYEPPFLEDNDFYPIPEPMMSIDEMEGRAYISNIRYLEHAGYSVKLPVEFTVVKTFDDREIERKTYKKSKSLPIKLIMEAIRKFKAESAVKFSISEISLYYENRPEQFNYDWENPCPNCPTFENPPKCHNLGTKENPEYRVYAPHYLTYRSGVLGDAGYVEYFLNLFDECLAPTFEELAKANEIPNKRDYILPNVSQFKVCNAQQVLIEKKDLIVFDRHSEDLSTDCENESCFDIFYIVINNAPNNYSFIKYYESQIDMQKGFICYEGLNLVSVSFWLKNVFNDKMVEEFVKNER